jgi:SAM-dependent methyltransferase
MKSKQDLQNNYDQVAEDYAQEYCHELEKKPFDRKILELLIEKVHGNGVICDMGCGPGQIARYLHDQGAEACGIDLSAEMIAQAARLHPSIPFHQGSMLDLSKVPDGSFGGVAAFYSIIHIPSESVVNALKELKRALRSGGELLLAFHIGKDVVHRDEWWGKKVSIDFYFFETDEMCDFVKMAGFELREVIERHPYPEEYQSRRAYIFARKP